MMSIYEILKFFKNSDYEIKILLTLIQRVKFIGKLLACFAVILMKIVFSNTYSNYSSPATSPSSSSAPHTQICPTTLPSKRTLVSVRKSIMCSLITSNKGDTFKWQKYLGKSVPLCFKIMNIYICGLRLSKCLSCQIFFSSHFNPLFALSFTSRVKTKWNLSCFMMSFYFCISLGQNHSFLL